MLCLTMVAASLAAEPSVLNIPPVRLTQEDEPGDTPATTAPAAGSADPERSRDYLMEVNTRGRYLFVPNSIIDIWYFNGTDDGGNHLDRPFAHGYAVGLEYVIRNRSNDNGIFYFEYWGNLMDEGYWDDRESDGNPVYTNGEYMVPNRFGVIAFGANYAYELHATKWLSFMFGAGLGLGLTIGELQSWEMADDGTPAYEVYETGVPPDGTVVPLNDGSGTLPVPLVDINAGVKFNINDRASIRLEGGLHTLFYGGAAVGVVF
ncbi:MAG: hypothetical protein H6739_02730 [Alphaproteobacteria bacterium]|nr:hypothetical protein [Alphaproteobacteria bacterium]